MKLKNRKQPYSKIVSSISMLKKYCHLDTNLESFATKIFPGPFTLILNKRKTNKLSKLLTLHLRTVGVRIPKSNFIIDVVNYINKPIITTSVNAHNEQPLNTKSSIEKKYKDFNLFYNFLSNSSKGSTIIDCTRNPYKIIRQGDGEIVI